ncbi:antibiotic biosynthesis monooxygenase [Thermus filiformis]|uniref:NIPSNAP family containing protein n=1 Tax=Thermus filiformis TaxID=276 RepID=A0A0D6XBW6_THEFI|nr:antibiotic biosynthesis monooxygenase [Thermus filiformis]KIX84821.1 NIPSNAP family containing protein [Thermus filiformis]
MTVQMRRYRLKEGAKEEFLRVFREVVLPLRKEVGFRVLGAYLLSEREFLWFVAHENFQEAEQAYYAHPRRLEVDPRVYLEEVETRFVEALEV